jgi:hypothetical protein
MSGQTDAEGSARAHDGPIDVADDEEIMLRHGGCSFLQGYVWLWQYRTTAPRLSRKIRFMFAETSLPPYGT